MSYCDFSLTNMLHRRISQHRLQLLRQRLEDQQGIRPSVLAAYHG